MKTYTNKSNAARAAKAANGGELNGYTLHGEEGAWYYAKDAKDSVGHVVEVVPVATVGRRTSDAQLEDVGDNHTVVRSAPAKRPAAKSAPKPAPAKKAAKKAAPVRKPATQPEVYDVRSGPTQGRISGYSIDLDRDEKHGVKRRSAGTIGGRLWAIFDKLSAKAGGAQKVEIGVVKESPLVADFNANKVVIEFYYWRRYNGVRGRGKKQKVAK